jgi:hypothetical protein
MRKIEIAIPFWNSRSFSMLLLPLIVDGTRFTKAPFNMLSSAGSMLGPEDECLGVCLGCAVARLAASHS